jgi:hypothetical protein
MAESHGLIGVPAGRLGQGMLSQSACAGTCGVRSGARSTLDHSVNQLVGPGDLVHHLG